MGKHLIIILTEMFRRVGVEYKPELSQGERWYEAHEWTDEESDSFVEWMSDYLYTNSEARKEIMNFPHKSKKKCRATAVTFNLWFGWKTKTTS